MVQYLASGGRDQSICVWDLDRRICAIRLTGHKSAISGVQFLNAHELVSCSLDQTLKLYDLTSGRNTLNLTDHDQSVTQVVSLGGSLIASASSDASVRVWDLRAAIPNVLTLFDHDAAVYGLVVMKQPASSSTAMPTTLISTSWDRTVKVWNLQMASSSTQKDEAQGRCVKTLVGHTDAVRAVVQLDSHHIATGGWDCSLRLWNIDEPAEAEHNEPLSPSSASSTHSSGSIVPSAACVGVIPSHQGWIYSLDWIPSTQSIVSGSGDRTIRLTSPLERRCTHILTGHENTVWDVCTLPSSSTSPTSASSSSSSPSSGSFVSSGADSQLRFWNVATKSCSRLDGGGHDPDTSIYCLDSWSSQPQPPLKNLVFPLTTNLNLEDTVELDSLSIAGEQQPQTRKCSASGAPSSAAALGPYACEPIDSSTQFEHSTLTKRPSNTGIGSTATSFVPASCTWTDAPLIIALPTSNVSPPPLPFTSSTSSTPAPSPTSASTMSDTTSTISTNTSSPPRPSISVSSTTSSPSHHLSIPSAAPTFTFDSTVHPLTHLREGQLKIMKYVPNKDWIEIEKILVFLLGIVEFEQSKVVPAPSSTNSTPKTNNSTPKNSNSPSSSNSSRLSPASLSSLIYYLNHDLSLCASQLNQHDKVLKYVSAALASFELDEPVTGVDTSAKTSKPATSFSYDANSGLTTREQAQRKRLTASGPDPRSKSLRQTLLKDEFPPTAKFHDILPTVLAIEQFAIPTPSTSILSTSTVATPTSSKSSSSSSPTPPSLPAAPSLVFAPNHPKYSLYVPLLLRRFWSAYQSTQLELAWSSATSILGLVEETDQRREIILDDLECAALAHPPQELPLKSIYSHLLSLYHQEVLVGMLHTKYQQIQNLKAQGNFLFEGHLHPQPTTPLLQALPAPPTPNYFKSLEVYEQALVGCEMINKVLDSPDCCPSFPWLELILAAPPNNSFLQPSTNDSSQVSTTPPSWHRSSLSFLHAQLYSNACMAALKVEEELTPSNRARRARIHSESGIDLCEKLQRELHDLREIIATTPKIVHKNEEDFEEEDDEEHDSSVRIFFDFPQLQSVLPTEQQVLNLLSKLYFRHGLACWEFDSPNMDQLAEQSWLKSISLQKSPVERERLKRDIQVRKDLRASQPKKKGSSKSNSGTTSPYSGSRSLSANEISASHLKYAP